MKVELEKQDKNQVLLTLEIPGEHAQQEYNKACRRLSQRVNIPGFRRGKAPIRMVERAVGTERIKQEALDRLLPTIFADVISEHELDIIAPPRIEKFNFDIGKPVLVKALMELRPEVRLPNLALQVEIPEYKAPADQEDKELEVLLERHTEFRSVEGRPAQENDIATIDFDGFVDGKPIDGGSAKGYQLDLANSPFIEGFSAQLVGKAIDEPCKVNVTFPDNYHEAALSGKPAEFDVTIRSLQERVVPELNDEFAKKVGNYESVADLREALKKALQEGVDRENRSRKEKGVVQELVKQIELDLPPTLVEREVRLLLEDVKQRFKSQNLSFDEFIESQGQEHILQNLREEAVTRIKTSFAIGAVAKQENLSLSEEEFNNQVQALARHRGVDEKAILRQLANNQNGLQAMTDQLLAQKVVDLLVEKATFTLVDEEEYISRLAETIDDEPFADNDKERKLEPDVVAVEANETVNTSDTEESDASDEDPDSLDEDSEENHDN